MLLENSSSLVFADASRAKKLVLLCNLLDKMLASCTRVLLCAARMPISKEGEADEYFPTSRRFRDARRYLELLTLVRFWIVLRRANLLVFPQPLRALEHLSTVCYGALVFFVKMLNKDNKALNLIKRL
jgi:hypothetical protein